MPRHTTNPGLLAKNFSSAYMRGFLNDVSRAEDYGHSRTCQQRVAAWLKELSNGAAVSIPDERLLVYWTVHERIDHVREAYLAWAEIPRNQEYSEKRRRAWERLRKKVAKLTSAYRVHTRLLELQVDVDLYRTYYDATCRLVHGVPQALDGTSWALRRFAGPEVLWPRTLRPTGTDSE